MLEGGVDLTAQAARLSGGMTPEKLASGWFSPSTPLPGLAPEGIGIGRTLDYNLATNTSISPKAVDGGLTYAQLRNLTESSDYVSIAIQAVIDRLAGMSGRVIDAGGNQNEVSAKADAINAWIRFPDGVTPLHDMLAKAAYDMCAIDAASAYVDKTDPAKPIAYVIDGASVLPFIDERGRIAEYGQIIRGQVAHHYKLDEIIFCPKNRRPHKIYGYSFVEQIATIVTLSLKRMSRQLDWFTRGNVPDVLISAPENWTPDQIKDMNLNWEKQLASISGKNMAKWFPAGSKVTTLDRNPSKDEFDEWLIRVICYTFSLPPTAFVKETNRATAQTTQDASLAEGHAAILRWAEQFLNAIINSAWGPGYVWQWDLTEKPSSDMLIKLLTVGAVKPIVCMRMGLRKEEIEDELPSRVAIAKNDEKEKAVDGETAKGKPKEDDDSGSQENADAGHVHSVLNADMDVLSDAGTALDNLLQDYLDDLREEAVKSGIEAFKTNAIFDLTDSPAFAIKATTHLTSAFGEGVDGAARELKAADLVNDAAEWARERSAWLVGMKRNADGDLVPNPDSKYAISDVCRANIRATIAQGLEEGWNDVRVQEKIAADNSFTPLRANKIASFETANAQEEGKLKVFAKTGTLATTWSDFDGCPICQANAAAGAVEIGKPFPSGHTHAPAHPHCRCSNLPAEVNE